MDDPEEHALVVKALADGLSNCVRWDAKSSKIVLGNPSLLGLTPAFIKAEVIKLVKVRGASAVDQRLETRVEYLQQYRFYYRTILPIDDFRHGVFVEMRLSDDENPDFPEVTIVGAHPQQQT